MKVAKALAGCFIDHSKDFIPALSQVTSVRAGCGTTEGL